MTIYILTEIYCGWSCVKREETAIGYYANKPAAIKAQLNMPVDDDRCRYIIKEVEVHES